jgi:membrane-associated protease RseP (regulator of RpoE activity)
MGAITPFRTPPPSIKSIFDVGIAGPLFGLMVSLGYLFSGLDITSHMSLDQLSGLPVFPSYVLRSSELGGSLVEFFLGKGTITQTGIESLIPLHPYAIAGSVGIISNALALLPLGNTDGGRVALAMFGRRGAYLVKTFTAVLLIAMGLFGFDESRILLVYVFIVQVWQRELETPALNEVDELDFPRGALGIVTAMIVALSLVPML